jgi:hypothetical protein
MPSITVSTLRDPYAEYPPQRQRLEGLSHSVPYRKGDMLLFGVFLWPAVRPEREFESHPPRCLLLPALTAVRGSALHARANHLQLGLRLRLVHQSEPLVTPCIIQGQNASRLCPRYELSAFDLLEVHRIAVDADQSAGMYAREHKDPPSLTLS